MGNCVDALEHSFGCSFDSIWDKDLIYADGRCCMQIQAWQALPDHLNNLSNADFFPEGKYLFSKADVALGFSGGGTRGFLCAIGYLAGFRDLGLLNKVKYIGGVSGSSWAVASFAYSQIKETDENLLGKLCPPQELDIVTLNEMPPNCLRVCASRDLAEALSNSFVPGCNFGQVWSELICDTFLRPVGIKSNHHFSYNEECVEDIKRRNLSLGKHHFYTVANEERPFPIFGATLVGPHCVLPDDEPFQELSKTSFSFVEITPLYVGSFHNQKIHYDFGKGTQEVLVGGAIEPIGCAVQYGDKDSAAMGLGKNSFSILSVPKPSEIMDLKKCVGAGSYASETLLDPNFVMKEEGALSLNYWSCVPDNPVPQEMVFADAAYSQTVPLISFLQRRVKNIIIFFESATPLKPSTEWNVDEDTSDESQIDKGFAGFFGVNLNSKNTDTSLPNFDKNQVFSVEDFKKVVKGLQQAQQKGEPLIYTSEMVTIQNSWWGIPSGIQTEITFFYLGHVPIWENQLPADTRKQLGGKEEFADFPFFPDNFNGISTKNANLLCNLAGWSVIQQKEALEKIFFRSASPLNPPHS